MTTALSLDLKPCPTAGEGVHKWVYYAACRAVEGGMSDDEAAEIIGDPSPTVRARVQSAKKRLRELLEQDGFR